MAKDTYIPRDELIDMNAEFNKVRAKAVKELMKFPGVVAVGVGMIVKDGVLLRELCFKVSVDKKKSKRSIKKKDRIPETIYGFKTDVVEVPNPIPLADQRHYRPIIGGSQIGCSKTASLGTLGCFAKRNNDDKIVALSNWHVMMSKGTALNDERIGQPSHSGCCSCCSCNEIGKVVAGQLDPNMDAAIALLDGQDADTIPEIRYLNEVHSIGIVSGSEMHLVGETVFKRGRTTKLTTGQIINDNTPFPITYKSFKNLVINFVGQLTIFPTLPQTDMILGGDSGSVLINEHNKVIALNFAGDDEDVRPRPAIIMAYASPIAPVLAALNISILDSTFASTANKQGVPLSSSTVAHRMPAFQDTLVAMEQKLRDYKLGNYLFELFDHHRSEVLSLLQHNREVKVSWNRYNGPAYISHIIRSIKRRKPIPDQIHGITLQNLLLKMTAVLQRNGSERLIEDVNNNYLTVMEIMGAGMTLEDWQTKLVKLNLSFNEQKQIHG